MYFEALHDLPRTRPPIEQIILDPPKFIDSKILSQGLSVRVIKTLTCGPCKIMRPGGILCTLSCSGLLSLSCLEKLVADAL